MSILQGMYGGQAVELAAANLMRSARMPKAPEAILVEPVSTPRMPKTPIVVPAKAVIVPMSRSVDRRKRAPKYEKAIAFLREHPEASREDLVAGCGISSTYADEIRAQLKLPSRRELRKQALVEAVRADKDFSAAAYAKKTKISAYVVYAMLRELLADKTVQRVIRYEVVSA